MGKFGGVLFPLPTFFKAQFKFFQYWHNLFIMIIELYIFLHIYLIDIECNRRKIHFDYKNKREIYMENSTFE